MAEGNASETPGSAVVAGGFGDTLKNLGTTRLAVMGGVLALLVIFFIFVSMRVSEPNMAILYSDLTTIDSSAIAGKLAEDGISFQVSPDGTRVFVPEGDIGKARMLLAQAGLPNGGSMGYEIFDQQSGFGTTSFVQNLNNKRALEGELARSIMALEQVVGAKVHIVLPQRELFAREARKATASVTLKLSPSERLNKQQIYGIQNLVANAVPELQAKSVTIIDTEANLLAGGEEEDDEFGLGGKAEDMRRSFERQLTTAIEDIVGRVVGINNVRATVTADLDFDRVSTNAEIFDPSGQVLRSTQIIEENDMERTPQNDGVTVGNNLPGIQALEGAGSAPTAESSRIESLENYEISRTVQSTVRESGEVNRLSVAVIVDGTYTTDEEGNKVYQDRTPEQMEAIRKLVESAVGYDASRGDVIEVANLPFADVEIETDEATDTLFGFSKDSILETVQMLTLGIMLLLVVLLVVKPILSQLFRSMEQDQGPDAPAQGADPILEAQKRAALAAPGGEGGALADIDGQDDDAGDTMINLGAVDGKIKASTVKKVGDIVENHPTETVSVLRSWMASD